MLRPESVILRAWRCNAHHLRMQGPITRDAVPTIKERVQCLLTKEAMPIT